MGHQRRCSFQVYGWHRVRVLLARRRMSARAAWRNRVALEAICAMAFAPSADGIDCAPYLDERGSNRAWTDRTSVGSGKSVSVRVDLGERRIFKKKKINNRMTYI